MFTGLVQGLGRITSISQRSGQRRFWITPLFAFPDIVDGESVAVNGPCLSVEEHRNSEFAVYASGETISRTTLSRLQQGNLVNLERAARLGDRMGGHLVTGHIDCVATVETVAEAGESLRIKIAFPREFGDQVIEKGSIALDGISLTVNQCTWTTLEVNVIPDSRHRTNIQTWRSGTKVNMETDLVGKYVLRAAKAWHKESGAMSRDFLASHGFI